jgi:hypothetical protein
MDRLTSFFRTHWAALALAACAIALVATGHLGAALGGGGLIFGGIVATDEQIRYLVKQGLLDAAGGMISPRVAAKTANYAMTSSATSAGDPSRSVFTNRGAVGAVTYTLPAPVQALTGVEYEFWGVAGQNTIVNAGGAGKGVAFNNAAITTVTCSTAGALIGAHIRAVCDGTSWLFENDSVGVTYTLA